MDMSTPVHPVSPPLDRDSRGVYYFEAESDARIRISMIGTGPYLSRNCCNPALLSQDSQKRFIAAQ